MDILIEYYLPLKALHLLSVIAWMAGLLYLPRLFVYHADQEVSSPTYTVFLTMEKRLLRIIMYPAMVSSFLCGGLLASIPGIINWSETWVYIKLASILVLAGLHGCMASWAKDFQKGCNRKSSRFFRLINEIPFVLAIIIVFAVILKF